VEALAVASYQATANNSNGAIGNPLNPATKVGAMDKGGFDAAQDYLAAARAAGARVIGGERLFADRFPNARYMAPALVLWHGVAAEKKRIMHEQEIFAPVANLDCVDSLEEAIHATNESTEHLSGGFYCDNAHIHELVAFIHGTHLGSLIHNGAPKDLSPEGVHAGRNEGGVGITGSLRGLDQYTRREPPNTIRLLAKVESLEAAHALAQALQEL
jgi:aldehyde dehydrogenase (NAD+)